MLALRFFFMFILDGATAEGAKMSAVATVQFDEHARHLARKERHHPSLKLSKVV